MKHAVLMMIALLLLFSCSKPKVEDIPVLGSLDPSAVDDSGKDSSEGLMDLGEPQSLVDRFSYAYGNLFASSLDSLDQEISVDYFVRGVLDYYGTPYFSDEQMQDIFAEYQSMMIQKNQERYEEQKKKNLEDAQAFLAVNGKRSNVITTPSGLQYERIRKVADKSVAPQEDDTVEIDYTITLLNGTVADSSYNRGQRAVVKVSQMIDGVKEGLMLMSPGEKYRFWIHPEKGYGENGVSVIGPNELLIFEVELYDIVEQ